MAKEYAVTTVDDQGKRRTWRFYASSAQEARQFLRDRAAYVVSLEERPETWLDFIPLISRRGFLSEKGLAFFFQQMAVLIQTGIPLVQAWRLAGAGLFSKQQRQRLEEVLRNMENGMEPSEAMEASGLFPLLACRIVQVGQTAGNLERVLEILGTHYEQYRRQRQSFWNALAYPLFLITCTLLLTLGAMWFVIPVFEEMFVQMAVPLPAPTRGLIHLHTVLQEWLWLWAPLGGLAVTAAVLVVRSEAGRRVIEKEMMHINVFRSGCLVWCWQRFSCVLAIEISGGIPLLGALEESAGVISWYWFRDRIRRVCYRVAGGMALSDAVRAEGIQTAYVEAMLSVGEATGDYGKSLQVISDYYEWELSLWAQRIRRLLEPAVLLFAGLGIGLVAFCLLLPLLDAASFLGM